jgi:predicted DNA-binding transcriptional regulator AlpA
MAADALGQAGAKDRRASVFTPELLTPQEVADLFRWSRDNVYVRAARGQLPGVVRIGHSLRFRAAAIRQLIEGVKAPAHPRINRRTRRGSR